MRNKKVLFAVQAAMIAALYVVLTVLRLYTRVLISLLFSMQLQSESVRSYQYVYLEAC